MKLVITLFFLICCSYDGVSQYFKKFSNPSGGDLQDVVRASCMQNDTVYALIQSGTVGAPEQTYLHKIRTTDGASIINRELINFVGYEHPSLMLIHDDILYIAHPAFDTIAYQIDRFRISDLSLISSDFYNADPNIGGYPRATITIFENYLILGGTQNKVEFGEGGIGFILWIDRQSMAVDSLMIYDSPDHFYNGVYQIGVYDNELYVLHSEGDHSAFRLKTYDESKNLILDSKILETRGRLSPLSIFRNHAFFTSNGLLVSALGHEGLRIHGRFGQILAEYKYSDELSLGIDIYHNRSKTAWMPVETKDGSLLFFGNGLIDLNQLDPFYSGQPFEEQIGLKTAFATNFTFSINELKKEWDYSYIDYDIHGNNKLIAITRIHELENGDLFGFGMGNNLRDSLVPHYLSYGNDLLTFRMDKNGCFEQDSCGANDVFYFFTDTDESGGLVKQQKDIKLFPQPAEDKMFVVIEDAELLSYELFDLSGSIIGSGILENAMIDVGDLLPGIYILKLINPKDNSFGTKKFVKQ